jgi:hypothetical protein
VHTAEPQPPTISMLPGPGEWLAALRSAPSDAAKRAFREQLGLSPDRAIIMSGHQAGVWHAGILAKWLVLRAAAARTGAQAAWLVVDTDTNDPSTVRFPVRDGSGALRVKTWASLPGLSVQGGRLTGHVVTGRVAGRAPAALPAEAADGATPGVVAGLDAIRDALAGHAGARSVAEQTALACRDLVARCFGDDGGVAIVHASALSRTSAFRGVLEKFAVNPARAVRTYLDAVGGSGVASASDESSPIWSLEGPARAPADPARIDPAHAEQYAPRALLLTGMMRWLGCEVFIHGTGGAGVDGRSGYDAVTAAWLGSWLSAAMAPVAMATATLRLNLPTSGPVPTPEAIGRAQWLAHAARHRPALLDDAGRQAQRDAALATLAGLRRKPGPDARRARLNAYRAMHQALRESRDAHRIRLDALDRQARDAALRRVEAEIVADRTWAFPLHGQARLNALGRQIDAEISAG